MFVRLILLAILFFLAYSLYYALRGKFLGGSPQQPEDRHSARGEQMVEDAHDGTYLPISQAVTARKDGKTLYFASKENRDAYMAQNK